MLLDSRIATTSNLTALLRVVRRPKEEYWTYPKLNKPSETALFQLLKAKFGDLKILASVFRFAWNATSELGIWCANDVWIRTLADDTIPKLQAKIGRESGSDIESPEDTERKIKRVEEAAQIVNNYKFQDPREPGQLNPKVELLLRQLTQHFGESKHKKCIVFTNKRNTAKTLAHLCEIWNIPNLRPGVLIGVRNQDNTGTVTFRDQFLVLIKFRQGKINCLVSLNLEKEIRKK